jgi:formylglycine-generating enzyme required for sulfatase activity
MIDKGSAPPRQPARVLRIAALALTAAFACASPRFGEVLLVVDTDVSVPRYASHLRVDLYDTDGTWYDSREIRALSAEWPLSFSLYTEEHFDKRVRVRLRVSPDGVVRTYRGEQPGPPVFSSPSVAENLDELCAHPPLLPPYVTLTQRRGAEPITDFVPQDDCHFATYSGSVAAQIEIHAPDTYRFEVVGTQPDGSRAFVGGDTTLFLRTACADQASQLACNDNIDLASGNLLSRLELPLNPGTYYLVTAGGVAGSPADVRLRWAPSASWDQGSIPPPPPDPPLGMPRLMVDGEDRTPITEPEPGVTIDRLIDLTVSYGRRRTAAVVLHGACLGTGVDLAGGTTCVDTLGERVAVAEVELHEGINRGGSTQAGTWASEQPAPCSAAPRSASSASDGTPLYDEEVCVPGGAFTLGGGGDHAGDDRSPVPPQVAVVSPFLLDRYEFTVARFRQALRDGFQIPDPLDFATASQGPAIGNPYCSWSGDATGPAFGVDREAFPMNCIGWKTARAVCQFLGGDLPAHVQWQYAARRGDGQVETRYPWGEDVPDCNRAVYGNGNDLACPSSVHAGPVAVDALPWAMGDVTPLGVIGLAGNVSEWNLDSYRPYSDPCWWQHALSDVGCDESEAPFRMVCGGNYYASADVLLASNIQPLPPALPGDSMGFRCVRPGAP